VSNTVLSAAEQESALQDFIDRIMAAQDRAECDARARAAYWATCHAYPEGPDRYAALDRLHDARREAIEAIDAREARS
jgi:hypothetical protein